MAAKKRSSKKRTTKKAKKPARAKKPAHKKKAARKSRKNKPVRRAGRVGASALKHAAPASADSLGEWHDAEAEEHALKHDPDDEFQEIGGSE